MWAAHESKYGLSQLQRSHIVCQVISSNFLSHSQKVGKSRWVPSWVQICSRFLPTVVPDRSHPLLLWRVPLVFFWLYKALRDAFRRDLVLCKQKLIGGLFVCCCAVPQTPWPSSSSCRSRANSSSSCRSRSNSSQSRWCQWWRAIVAQAPGALACVTAAATWAPVSHSQPQDFSFFFAFEMECLLKQWRRCTHCNLS